MSELLKVLPKEIKILLWICIAHLWILTCAIVYVQLEGFSNKDGKIIIQESQLAMKMFSKTSAEEIKASQSALRKYHENYKEKLETLQYWKGRNEFNDVSKAYVFVLLSYTTIGSQSTLQTWQSQLFYVFTMPFGVLLYILMIHSIVSRFFDIIAYSAVVIFPKTQLEWTVDQRDLYEKIKVFLLAFLLMVIGVLMFGLLGMFSAESYIAGLYHVVNTVFFTSYGNEFIPFKGHSHIVIATLMTFYVFACMLLLFTTLYSAFIMLRYNDWSDIWVVLFDKDTDLLNDAETNDEMLEFKNEGMGPGIVDGFYIPYLPGCNSTLIPTKSRQLMEQKNDHQNKQKQIYQGQLHSMRTYSSSTSTSECSSEEYNPPTNIKKTTKDPPLKMDLTMDSIEAPFHPPSIRVLSPTPPATNDYDLEPVLSQTPLNEASSTTELVVGSTCDEHGDSLPALSDATFVDSVDETFSLSDATIINSADGDTKSSE